MTNIPQPPDSSADAELANARDDELKIIASVFRARGRAAGWERGWDEGYAAGLAAAKAGV